MGRYTRCTSMNPSQSFLCAHMLQHACPYTITLRSKPQRIVERQLQAIRRARVEHQPICGSGQIIYLSFTQDLLSTNGRYSPRVLVTQQHCELPWPHLLGHRKCCS